FLILFVYSLSPKIPLYIIPKSLDWVAIDFAFFAFTLIVALYLFQKSRVAVIFISVLIVVSWFLFSIWILNHETIGLNDVWYVLQASVKSLSAGDNPYTKIFDVPLKYTDYPVENHYVLTSCTIFF